MNDQTQTHKINIQTYRHKSGWTYTITVDQAGTYDTDRTYITRQAAIEAEALQLVRELPALIDQDLLP